MVDFIRSKGIHQEDLYNMLKELQDNFNDMCTELTTDTNGTFTGTTYDVTINQNGQVVTGGDGPSNDIVYAFLKDWIHKFNALMTALDSTDLTAITYASGCAITDNFDDSTKSREITATGMYQGDLVDTLQNIITALAACTTLLDADALCSGYATAYDVTDTVDTDGA